MKDPAKCEGCPIRRLAERKPRSLIARIWNWHKGWCPGWKASQRALEQKVGKSPQASHDREPR